MASGQVVSIDGLTEQERRFVDAFCSGMNQTQAARAAGYSEPTSGGVRLMKRPAVLAAIERERAALAEQARVKREDVIEGFKEAIDMARTLQDPVAMIAGWREVGRVLGHYEPEKKKVEISINGQVALQQLEALPDAELAKLIEGEVIDVAEEEAE